MKNLFFVFALLLVGQFSYAQSYECGGIKFTYSKELPNGNIEVLVDATNYPHRLSNPNSHSGSQVKVINGTCEGCQNFHQGTGTWIIKPSGSAKPVLEFTSFAGSCNGQSFTLENTGLSCGGIVLTQGATLANGDIEVLVDATNYPHRLSNPNSHAGSQVKVINGTCIDCRNFNQDTGKWVIRPDGSAKPVLELTRFTGSCKGTSFSMN